MQKGISKATVIAIAILLSSVAFIANTPVQAQAQLAAQQPVSGPLPAGVTANTTVPTFACLSFRPNPVGVNQVFMVNLWTTTSPGANRFHQDYTVTITKPDGTKNTIVMDSFVADGTAWFEYVADQLGEWKLKFDFPGEYYPAGRYYNGYIVTNSSGSIYDSCYYSSSSTKEQTLTVQADPILSWPDSPLPTDYWTRPVTPYNRAWWQILGNYPWNGMGLAYYGPTKTLWYQLYPGSNPFWSSQQRFTPWVQGPNSAHIVWKRQGVDAGIVGGDIGSESIAPGGIQGLPVSSTPDIIYQG